MHLIEFRTLGTLDLRGAEGRALHSLLAQSEDPHDSAVGAGVPDKLLVVENWFEELKTRARS